MSGPLAKDAGQAFARAHRIYVKGLYKRYLVNELNWIVQRSIWRERALEVRAQFDQWRNITDPRALAIVLEQAEDRLARRLHPDPVRPTSGPDGTKWERNIPPPVLDEEQQRTIYKELRRTLGPNVMRRAEEEYVPEPTEYDLELAEALAQQSAGRVELRTKVEQALIDEKNPEARKELEELREELTKEIEEAQQQEKAGGPASH